MIQCMCIWTCIYIVHICLLMYEANSMEYDKHLDEGTVVLETCRRAWKDHSLPMVTLTVDGIVLTKKCHQEGQK